MRGGGGGGIIWRIGRRGGAGGQRGEVSGGVG